MPDPLVGAIQSVRILALQKIGLCLVYFSIWFSVVGAHALTSCKAAKAGRCFHEIPHSVKAVGCCLADSKIFFVVVFAFDVLHFPAMFSARRFGEGMTKEEDEAGHSRVGRIALRSTQTCGHISPFCMSN